MSVAEIQQAIAELPAAERRALIRSLTPRFVKLSEEEKQAIRDKADAVPDDEWISWEEIKSEFEAAS